MNVTLIGQTASGKTTLGRALVDKLNNAAKGVSGGEGRTQWVYRDLDHEVEVYYSKQKGYENPTPISEMYKEHTEEQLKRYFKEVYEELSSMPNTIIGTGGFFAMYFEFPKRDNVYFVNVSKRVFAERIMLAKQNPHLPENANRRIIHKEPSEIHKQYEERNPVYMDKCGHVFDVSCKRDECKLVDRVYEFMVVKMKAAKVATSDVGLTRGPSGI